MIIAIILFSAFGFFLIYNASKKIKLGGTTFEKSIQKHKIFSKYISSIIMLLSGYWFIYEFGLAIGIFYATIVFTTIISLVVLLLPLRYK
jgi:hypothetical protein